MSSEDGHIQVGGEDVMDDPPEGEAAESSQPCAGISQLSTQSYPALKPLQPRLPCCWFGLEGPSEVISSQHHRQAHLPWIRLLTALFS